MNDCLPARAHARSENWGILKEREPRMMWRPQRFYPSSPWFPSPRGPCSSPVQRPIPPRALGLFASPSGAYARAHELVACVPAHGWRDPRRTGRAGPGRGAPTTADGYVPQSWAHACEPSRGASAPPGASLRNHRHSRHHRRTKNLRHRNGHRDGRPRRTRSGGNGGRRPTRSRGRHRRRPPTNSPRRHWCCGGTSSCSRRTCRPSGSPYGSRGARPRPRPWPPPTPHRA